MIHVGIVPLLEFDFVLRCLGEYVVSSLLLYIYQRLLVGRLRYVDSPCDWVIVLLKMNSIIK